MTLSNYAAESYLGWLVPLVKSPRPPAVQVARRIYERIYFGVEVEEEKPRDVNKLKGRISSSANFSKYPTEKYNFNAKKNG